MARYIDADELKKCSFVIAYKDERNITQYGEFVEVVRCKECKWFNTWSCAKWIVDESDKPKENDFCSWGERRDE